VGDESTTRTVNDHVPWLLRGTPEMTPVAASSARPDGRLPETIDQVSDPWPPVDARVAEYDT
jgi:hypothetical protein